MTAPRVIGQTDDGRVRLRGSFGFEEYRQLSSDRPNDVNFTPPVSSAQGEVSRNRGRALASARDTERQSETVRGALDRKANRVVGPAIRPNPAPDVVWLGQDVDWMLEYQQAASSAFQEWATDIFCRNDAEGHYHFGGLMWQGFRTLTGPDAEVGGYIGYDRVRADRKGSKWATFVHLFDPDRVSTPDYMQDGEHPNQPRMAMGRELDEQGAMQALHVSVRHPSDLGGQMTWERIPRATDFGRPMAFHWFFKRRAGLQRAITTLAAVLSTIQMLGQFSKATLQTAVAHSYMAAYVKTTMSPEAAAAAMAPRQDAIFGRDEDGNPLSEYDARVAAYDQLGLKMGSKRIPIMGPNDEIMFQSLEGAAMDFDPFRNAFLRELASSLNVSFEQLSLNYSLASYSSTRSSLVEAWSQITFERIMYTNHVANLVYDAVIEEAFALGILKEPPGAPAFYEARQAYTRCTWTGPGMGWVDPLKEIEATKGRMGAMVSSPQQEAANQGGNVFDNIRDAAIAKKFAQQHDVEIDTGASGTMPGAAGDAQTAAQQADNEASQDDANA